MPFCKDHIKTRKNQGYEHHALYKNLRCHTPKNFDKPFEIRTSEHFYGVSKTWYINVYWEQLPHSTIPSDVKHSTMTAWDILIHFTMISSIQLFNYSTSAICFFSTHSEYFILKLNAHSKNAVFHIKSVHVLTGHFKYFQCNHNCYLIFSNFLFPFFF